MNELIEIAPGLWQIDGPVQTYRYIPLPTRSFVIGVKEGLLALPLTPLTPPLATAIRARGALRHLLLPNPRHGQHMAGWQAAFPEARIWQPPLDVPPWQESLDHLTFGRGYTETALFHHASQSLILTDLIHNIDTAALPAWARPMIWIDGTDNSDGKMPRWLRWRLGPKPELLEKLDRLIKWQPERVLLAHGESYRRNGTAELERAFRRLLHNRRWDQAFDAMKKR